MCSAANLSGYRITAHCEIVRVLGIQGPKPEQVALDHCSTDLPVTMKALLKFASKLNGTASKVSRRDIDVLHTYGYSAPQIVEAVDTVGFAKFANFVAFALGTTPDFDPPKAILTRFEAVKPETPTNRDRPAFASPVLFVYESSGGLHPLVTSPVYPNRR